MELFNMEKCYDYFDCNKTECVIFQNKGDKPCWDTEGTLCFFSALTPIIETNNENENEKCDYCLYKSANYKEYELLSDKS